MKRYAIELNGTGIEKIFFMVIFTLACCSIVFLPFAIVFLATNLEIREIPY